ncbi:retrovirus-related pol polyprotein from transposon TNT 1-94 [Tanacetum coccineum]
MMQWMTFLALDTLAIQGNHWGMIAWTQSKVVMEAQLGNVTISRVYYVEVLGHNLFFVGQFCDAYLEVAFWKNTCFIRNLEGADLLSRSRDTNLYTISVDDMLKRSTICLLSKASKTKSWLWHRRLSDLNFSTLNKLAKDGLVRGIPKLKFQKDHLCSAYALGKIIVDDYSRFTWVRFLKSKDEAPDTIIKCIKNIQVHLNTTVYNVRTDNGTEFVNQTLCEFYENVCISHQTSVARPPQQNGIWDNEDVHDLGSVETEFPAIVFNDTLTSEVALSCKPTVSSLNNDEFDFRISFDESDDEDCTGERYFEDYYSEDQYAVSINEEDGVPCLCKPSPRPEDKAQYAVSRETQYAVFKIWNEYNILEDIKRGPYSKKSPIRPADKRTHQLLRGTPEYWQSIFYDSTLVDDVDGFNTKPEINQGAIKDVKLEKKERDVERTTRRILQDCRRWQEKPAPKVTKAIKMINRLDGPRKRKETTKKDIKASRTKKRIKGSNENEDIEDTAFVITGENIGPKPNPGKDIKVKKSKNKQKPTRNEETSDQEKT